MRTIIARDVIGYEGLYLVTDAGGVFSCRRKRYLKPSTSSYGYLAVSLAKDRNSKRFFVHRLVAASFLGVSRLQVNHLDGDKKNNTIKNLEYVTNRENKSHSLLGNGKLRGVYQQGRRWRARTEIRNKPLTIGTYDTKEEAFNAYKCFCEKIGEAKHL